ncbi:MAG: PAS sensor histidine kinase [halophilic archaeon J07HX64]|jgi:PAS domain S-box|nr:MAG: PAS sensor histidine kinase [halophilic archaeon J07HX64]
MRDRICILSVHGTDHPLFLGSERLAAANPDFVVETAHSVDEAVDRLTAGTFDCVLSAYRLSGGDGITLLRRVRSLDPELPFVLHTHRGSEEVASEAITAGVTDYISADPGSDQTESVAARLVDVVSEQSESGQESQVRELVEVTDDVLWMVSADWDELLSVNSAYSAVWGQPETALRENPMAFLDAVHPDDRDRARAAVEQVTDGESVEIELRVDPTAEFQRQVLVQANPVLARDGSVTRIVGVTRDVTEQRDRQRRLEAETQMVDSIFDALPDVLYTFDTAGYLLRWNRQLEMETGYTADDIEEMHVTDFVPADQVEPIAESFQAIVEERRSVTVESAFETTGGERIPFEFTGAPLEAADGSLRGVTGIGRNIAEQRRQQRRFEAVFDNTYQFTGLMSPDGTLLEVNQAAVEFSGRDRDELVGEKIWEAYWFQNSETVRQTVREAVETASSGEFFRDQIPVQGSNREAVIDFSVRPVTDEDSTVELLIPEGRDITRLSEREQQLEVTNRFLRHNIRNKLTTIQGYATLVSEADADPLRSYGTAIDRAATELDDTAEMARDIHELIQRDPTPEPVDIVDQLDQAITVLRDRYPDADITAETPDSLTVMGLRSLDGALVELVATLFAGATGDNPSVRVALTGEDTPVLRLGATGCALSAAEQEVLAGKTEIDQIRHAQGLGVWYVYWQVWYSGGEISVAGDGGQVELSLPPAR